MRRLWQQLAIATNWPVLVAVGVLVTIGLASIRADDLADPSRAADWPKQLVFVMVSLVCMAVFQAVDYRKIGRYAWPFYILSLLLIFYTVLGAQIPGGLPGAKPIKGACNWIKFGPVSLQPAELMKIAFVLLLARYLRFRENYRRFFGLLPPFAFCLIPLALILKQPDLGTALVFIPALFAMLYAAGAKIRHLLAVVALALTLAPVAWLGGTDLPIFRHLPTLVKDYQRQRVYAMFASDPATLQRTGYQQHYALAALGSGGVGGKGLGNIPVGSKVPEAHNDMIFALIGEQFGFFGSAVVLVAYIVLFAAGIEIAANTKEPYGRLIVIGIVAYLSAQTFLNLAVALKIMPVTGVTLPFVSYGGSSLLANFMAVGLLLNIGQNRPVVMAREAFEFD